MKAPCLHCPDRHPRCHGECEKYQAYNAERERIRAKRQQERLGDSARISRLEKLQIEAFQSRKK